MLYASGTELHALCAAILSVCGSEHDNPGAVVAIVERPSNGGTVFLYTAYM